MANSGGLAKQGRVELDLPRPVRCLFSAGAPYFFSCAPCEEQQRGKPIQPNVEGQGSKFTEGSAEFLLT